MLWVDYNIESFADGSFTVIGDWDGEVMGKDVNGKSKSTCLYKPGDVFVVNEHGILKNQLDNNVKSDEKLNTLFQSLKDINAKLWVIEDDKRLCEKNSDFTENFIKLSRDVHFLNDDRAKIKLEMNNHTGSKIKEIKEYTSY